MDYETCEVSFESQGMLWWVRYAFLARAIGPYGPYVVATSKPFANPPADRFNQQNHAATGPLDELTQQLTREGWEWTGTGSSWFSPQFRRPLVATEGTAGATTVMLLDAGRNKIAIIKIVREATRLGLKEAKDLVESAPTPICRRGSRAEADQLAEELTRAGARAEIR